MNQQRYGRESSAADVEGAATRPVDDISVVPAHGSDVAPQRTIAPAAAPRESRPQAAIAEDLHTAESAPALTARRHLRAVPGGDGGDRQDPLGTAVETVGAAVGWTAGYVKNRRPAEIRSDAERFVSASPALALVAALGFGFLLGSYMRR